MRQKSGHQVFEPVPLQKSSESEQAGSASDFLVGKTDLDGFLGRFEFNKFAHCLVSRMVRLL